MVPWSVGWRSRMLIRHVPPRPWLWLYPQTLLDMGRPPRPPRRPPPLRPASPQQHISDSDVTVYPLALAMGRNSRRSRSRISPARSASGRLVRGLVSMLILMRGYRQSRQRYVVHVITGGIAVISTRLSSLRHFALCRRPNKKCSKKREQPAVCHMHKTGSGFCAFSLPCIAQRTAHS